MNTSGLMPTEYNVLVLPIEVEDKTKGGLYLPDKAIEKEEFGRVEGNLVAVSPLAFSYAEWPDGARKPQVGDRVMFSKYQATEYRGADAKKYWLMKDKSIAGILTDGGE